MLLARLCSYGSAGQVDSVVAALRRFSTVAAALAQQPPDREAMAGQPSPWTHPEVRARRRARRSTRSERAARASRAAGATPNLPPKPHRRPQLLRPGELQPGVTNLEIAARRQRLCSALPPNTLAVLPSADISYMAGIIPHPYRQDADFLYLTGLNQRAVAVLQNWADPGAPAPAPSPSPSPAAAAAQHGAHSPGVLRKHLHQQAAGAHLEQQRHKFVLFIPPPDEAQERWDGATVGRQAAQDMFGAHEVHYIDQVRRAGGAGWAGLRCAGRRPAA
jgi:hypothetical protein